jgi:putative ABC transport system permease protein
MAVRELKVNRTRTFLTLLGIAIGIFCIISVFSIVDSMKKNIQTSIESLGSNVLYVQKWPWEFSSDYAWWKYIRRPVPSLEDYKEISKRSKTVQNVVFVASAMTNVENGDLKITDLPVIGITGEYPEVQQFEIAQGRFFTESEIMSGLNVAILGSSVRNELFPNIDPLGKTVKLFNLKVRVIGSLASEGQGPFSGNHDRSVIVPVNFFRKHIDIRNDQLSNTVIMVKSVPGISNLQVRDELTGILRSVRRLKPTVEDNFSINESSLLTKGFEGLFSVLRIAGWLIGSFSLLVGGFGIANIMFVSVSERTRIIGIQKAMGAKKKLILFQYLTEAVFLSILGGVIGMALVAALLLAISSGSDFSVFITAGNVATAVGICVVIGIVSGLAPALRAARLDPVEAIRR